jgi:hypothetical protein
MSKKEYDNGSILLDIDYTNGGKYWYVNGKLHRDNDLPAIEKTNDLTDEIIFTKY